MTRTAKELDVVARHVIRAAEEDLRHWIGIQQLDGDLLSALYLRVREVLERSVAGDDAIIDDVALTIYLTASAWQPKGDPPLDLLPSLHRVIARTLSTAPSPIAPAAGARRIQ